MFPHHFDFKFSPASVGNYGIVSAHEIESFLGLYMLAVGHLKHETALADLRPYSSNCNARLFKEFAASGF